MGLVKILLSIFKKLGKLFGKKAPAKKVDDRLPGERRIAIYGPSAVGKSVFFTMLYSACRQDREFNLAPEDQATAAQLLNNLETIRAGKWLMGTVGERDLNFKASLRGGRTFPFSTKDYKGETIDLELESEAREALIEYFQNCDAILFMLAPEMINDPRKCEREIMNFQAMISKIVAPGGKGLRKPIGLMITKSDCIAGFENENQTQLIARNAEYLKAKSFPAFVDGVCEQYHIKRNIVFQAQVREILQRLSLFFDYMMTVSMEFEVFFISSVGKVETIEQPGGQVYTRPPRDPGGIGIKKPFLWVVETVRRRERIAAFNRVRRGLFSVAAVVLLLYAVVYGLHLLPKRLSFEQMRTNRNSEEVEAELRGYAKSRRTNLVGLFPLPGAHAREIPADADKLLATYQAYLFLSGDLANARTAEALRAISESFASGKAAVDSNGIDTAWFGKLTDSQQSVVWDGLSYAIATHNIKVVEEARDLKNQLNAAGQPSEMKEQYQELRAKLVELPSTKPPSFRKKYFDNLDSEIKSLETETDLTAGERTSNSTWTTLLKKLNNICVGPYQAAPFEKLRDDVNAFGETLYDGGPQLQSLAAPVRQLGGLLGEFISAQAETDPGRKLAGLKSVVDGAVEFPPLRVYVDPILRNAGDDQIKLQIENKWDKDNKEIAWFIGDALRDRVKKVRDLPGERQTARKLYLENLERMQKTGVPLNMQVKVVPNHCAVTYWDHNPQVNGYVSSSAGAGRALKVKWYAGQKFRIAVQYIGEAVPRYCSHEGNIWDFKDPIPLICEEPRTSGQVAVTFTDLESTIEEQLVKPLREAFAD